MGIDFFVFLFTIAVACFGFYRYEQFYKSLDNNIAQYYEKMSPWIGALLSAILVIQFLHFGYGGVVFFVGCPLCVLVVLFYSERKMFKAKQLLKRMV